MILDGWFDPTASTRMQVYPLTIRGLSDRRSLLFSFAESFERIDSDFTPSQTIDRFIPTVPAMNKTAKRACLYILEQGPLKLHSVKEKTQIGRAHV